MLRRNIEGKWIEHVSSWRRMAQAMWKPSYDPTTYGLLEVDMSNALDYIGRLSASSGQHVTVTHIVTKALADTLAQHPECNVLIRRRRIFQRDRIGIFVIVAIEPPGTAAGAQRADLTGIMVQDADRKSLVEVAAEIEQGAGHARTGSDAQFARMKWFFDHVPIPLLRQVVRLTSLVQYELNVDLSPVGIPRDSFGSATVTSVGMHGLRYGLPPMMPTDRNSVGLVVGRIADHPVAVHGEVVIRPMLPVTAVVDHRVIDGFQAGQLCATFERILRDPAAHFDHAGEFTEAPGEQRRGVVTPVSA